MINIPRWALDWDNKSIGLRRHGNGEWVRWSDCERLMKRIDELQKAYTEIRAAGDGVSLRTGR